MIIGIYGINIEHNFNFDEYIKIFDKYINKFYKDESACEKFNIELIINPYEFIFKPTRSPSVYFTIHNIFDGMFISCNDYYYDYEYRRMIITGMFNDNLKYSQFFWRYNETLFDNHFLPEDRKIKSKQLKDFYNYLIKYALPVLSNQYTKDLSKFKSIEWRI